jgi:hypothetical protein
VELSSDPGDAPLDDDADVAWPSSVESLPTVITPTSASGVNEHAQQTRIDARRTG